ncbi:hypothetical protein [uncultured Psychromonas sp.]|uniref:hypothetical protein n=1 Tax=uncultured Psychromonas sp. TaxID=173974 RepID=UPI00262D4A1B|nr:hypothetical protein [uncultured Psychromonas sp.]
MKKDILVNEVFENIDQELIKKGIPITSRYMEAIGDVSRYFNNERIPISPNSLLPENDFGNQLCIWLHQWYDHKYGDNQKYNSDLGFLYHKIRGDLWFYRVPEFYGCCNFFISKKLEDTGCDNETNILRMSPKMTQVYIDSLNETECIEISISFQSALDAFQILNGWRLVKIPYYQAIRADLKTITIQLDVHISNFGQVRWAYMQCAEKILKSWLLKAGLTEKELRNQKKFGHKIDNLVNAFNEYYVEKVSTQNLDYITCGANARYDDNSYESEDIVKAQKWLFDMVKAIDFKPSLATR